MMLRTPTHAALILALVNGLALSLSAQAIPVPRTPRVVSAPTLTLPAEADSNSPAYWDLTDGLPQLHVLTSSGHPVLNVGTNLRQLVNTGPVTYTTAVDGRRWMEAVLQDEGGVLYGYYHLEPNNVCPEPGLTIPRIGAARSEDRGRTWEDLGVVLEAPPGTEYCGTRNKYFAGGVGDFTVILDQEGTELYFFFSSYFGTRLEQGVAAARMPWAERDAPAGHIEVWYRGAWRPALLAPISDEPDGEVGPVPSGPTPIFVARVSWHDLRGRVDAFWGPSVHWNTHLEQYVMLLNRAMDNRWMQEGIYISFARALDRPGTWSTPRRLVQGGNWYPQVMGLEPGAGTDKLAGERARLFIAGRSEQLLVFRRE